ncbi:hypothetical protein LEP1GSC060_3260 [Leptospira weilii serovar Ranarum str. ICFT]|uniref:Uncharacterized protein n=1 Tax=Leptospira weilii serovar Ranarum str. ICFT TaxID=1218598 RepID=N1W924_9LEPT|nr:hypothetical protein [Leptospira weilii]EMY76721.1 hypothetical protein LEP1GSC060_3260 [Leptospira weilii serovar Ranarum str. ICFT]
MENSIDPKREEWRKLISKKDDFRKIVSTLNDFYIPKIPFSKLDEGQRMRVRLAKGKIKNFDVFLKKTDDHEFLIFLKVADRFESWIHQDGVGQAKEHFSKEGKTDHLVFRFPCIGELYEKHSAFVREEEMKTPNAKDSA